MKKLCLTAAILMTATASMAQDHLPPVFGADTALFRKDIMTRSYMTPKKILWTSSATAVQNAELLLKPNTGQADIFGDGMCRLINNGNDQASLILDFGHELHGGFKMVISSCST